MEIWKIIYFKICVLIFFISSEIQRNTQCVGCKCSNKERQRERNSETKETKSTEKSKFMLKHLNRYSYCPVLLLEVCWIFVILHYLTLRPSKFLNFHSCYLISLDLMKPNLDSSQYFVWDFCVKKKKRKSAELRKTLIPDSFFATILCYNLSYGGEHSFLPCKTSITHVDA